MIMEDKYSVVRQHSGIWKCLRDGDFEEEEVWDAIRDRPDYSFGIGKSKNKESSILLVPRPLPTAARRVPSTSSSHEAKVFQQSAPVNIPDWSKIYRNCQNEKGPRNVSRFDDDDDVVANYGGDSDEDDDECDSKLAPHEFIARRLARSQISSFSVLEGVGRTLKGRDLSKVRDAVLTKTGFLESL